ncbi:hypothetical protein [Desulfobacterium sp. N47]|uniref:DUF2281 domain-containing protein n=1 Tax=uncultured Desulfobacterium sp. TaxID=201089 RepID=E1YMC9_9BACT|nr:unknown protein [uncultured Desulfobacterium sp.]
MNVADKICEKVRDLPEPLAREVLDFIKRIYSQHDICVEEMKKAQVSVMQQIWGNKEDDIWNEL